MKREYQRIALEAYSRELHKNGFRSRMILSPGNDFILQVDVPGPFHSTADFRLESSFSYVVNQATLVGVYSSDLLEEAIVGAWPIASTDDPALVTALVILDFVEKCIYKEHEAMLEIELVTEDNLEEFAMFLSDEALQNEDVYAIGFRVKDAEIPVTAGAASFYLTEDDLVIDDVQILPEYQELGIETFIVNYIQKKVLS